MKVLITSVPKMYDGVISSAVKEKLTNELAGETNYLFRKDRVMSSVGKFLIEHLLLESGISRHEIHSIIHSEFGKPFLPGHELDFNISHSGDIVVAAISQTKGVGIDVEQIRQINVEEYESVFQPAEWKMILDSNSVDVFFDLWAKKESLLKAYGLGLQVELDKVCVSGKQGQINNQFFSSHFHKIDIPGYACYVCTTFECDKIDVSFFSLP